MALYKAYKLKGDFLIYLFIYFYGELLVLHKSVMVD